MPRRRLTPEDRAAWERVRASARPLRPAPPGPPRSPEPPGLASPPASLPFVSAPSPRAAPTLSLLPRPFRVGEAAAAAGTAEPRRGHDLLPGMADRLRRAPLRMDAGTFGRMSRGKVRPEARLDLHGMYVAEAHAALADFVLRSRRAGRRLVLVITGKGRGGGRDGLAPLALVAGRLRHEVPRWLALPPLAGAVLQVAPAHPRHGGEGAIYVYLRAP